MLLVVFVVKGFVSPQLELLVVQYWALNTTGKTQSTYLSWLIGKLNVEELNKSSLFCCKWSFWKQQLCECVIQPSSLTFLNIFQALGNHEFDNGVEGLMKPFMENIQCPVLSANIKPDRNLAPTFGKSYQPYKILDVNGVKVGVVGYTAQETPALSRTGKWMWMVCLSSVCNRVPATWMTVGCCGFVVGPQSQFRNRCLYPKMATQTHHKCVFNHLIISGQQ